ncbi:MAG: hypothetical protein KKB31_00795 [Nanoarchaeota archaeon]|nr:hypothetical protein [Nanoarchaeota archaeon]
MKKKKDALDKLIVKNPFYFRFGKYEFVSYGKNYREAVRRIATQIQYKFKRLKGLPLLVQIEHKKKITWWDIREFLKEAGIKIKIIKN